MQKNNTIKELNSIESIKERTLDLAPMCKVFKLCKSFALKKSVAKKILEKLLFQHNWRSLLI